MENLLLLHKSGSSVVPACRSVLGLDMFVSAGSLGVWEFGGGWAPESVRFEVLESVGLGVDVSELSGFGSL